MEGLENPTPRTLRVMRFKLEANNTLNEQLALQLTEHKRNLASFAFYASQQVFMTLEDYYNNEGQLHGIGKRFRGFNEPFHLQPIVKSKQMDEQTTRIAFSPVEQAVFDEAVSLDPVRMAGQNSWDVRSLPTRITGRKNEGHYVFVDVPTSALLSTSQRKMATRTMISKLEMGQLWVHTDSLMKVRDMTLSQKPALTDEHVETGDDGELEQVG
ncbi:hypothetical protein H7100_00280 [Candidatus Saccharibacteria bacterium]|nr:hypothetical protein [Candidatus Saccharibacteria bacterium]